jgi:hypothetical protein
MVTIDSISKPFRKKIIIDEHHLPDLIYNWFEQIDKIYFSSKNNSEIKIKLDKTDKKIISLSSDCKDKLKTLSFKKNIKIIDE